MDLLIKNMSLPKLYNRPLVIMILPDGTVKEENGGFYINTEKKAIALPEHGRLIDADEGGKVLLDKYTEGLDKWDELYRAGYRYALKYFSQAPTVLEATK